MTSVACNLESRFSGYHGKCVDDADDCWMTEVRGIEHPPSSLKRGIIPASWGGPRPSSRSAPSGDHRGSGESTTNPPRDLASVRWLCSCLSVLRPMALGVWDGPKRLRA